MKNAIAYFIKKMLVISMSVADLSGRNLGWGCPLFKPFVIWKIDSKSNDGSNDESTAIKIQRKWFP